MAWIKKYMKNDSYNIIPTKKDGNCFFECLRESIKDSGMKFELNTINDFRRYLHDVVTEDYYNIQMELYLMLKAVNPSSDAITEFKYLDNYSLDTFKKFKNFILKKSFWANKWAINELEKKLNVKAIILSEEKFDDGDKDVIQCSRTDSITLLKCNICGMIKGVEYTPKQLKEFSKIHDRTGTPNHFWIDVPLDDYETKLTIGFFIVTYTGAHYEIISYNGKIFFENPNDLPEDLKKEINIQCVGKMIDFEKYKGKDGPAEPEKTIKRRSPTIPTRNPPKPPTMNNRRRVTSRTIRGRSPPPQRRRGRSPPPRMNRRRSPPRMNRQLSPSRNILRRSPPRMNRRRFPPPQQRRGRSSPRGTPYPRRGVSPLRRGRSAPLGILRTRKRSPTMPTRPQPQPPKVRLRFRRSNMRSNKPRYRSLSPPR